MNREEPSCRSSLLGAWWTRSARRGEGSDSTTDVIRSVELVLMILWQMFVMQTSQRFLLQTSHGEGFSVLDLPSYVFMEVIVTFKKSDALGFTRAYQVS
jgi:hypothetical protein